MFYYSTSSTVYNIIYTSYQLRFPFSLCHHSFYPISSINHPKNSGQKTVFFHSFLAPKSPLNHYMLWSNPIISPLNHNTSSELYSQREIIRLFRIPHKYSKDAVFMLLLHLSRPLKIYFSIRLFNFFTALTSCNSSFVNIANYLIFL